MKGTADHGERGALEAGLGPFELQADPLDEGLLGDPLPLVRGIDRRNLGKRRFLSGESARFHTSAPRDRDPRRARPAAHRKLPV